MRNSFNYIKENWLFGILIILVSLILISFVAILYDSVGLDYKSTMVKIIKVDYISEKIQYHTDSKGNGYNTVTPEEWNNYVVFNGENGEIVQTFKTSTPKYMLKINQDVLIYYGRGRLTNNLYFKDKK